MSKTVSGSCDDESMTGDDQDDTSTAREAVVDARREAAAALARLAEAAVRYADCRTADDTAAGVGSGRRSRVGPGEFVADELALLLRDQAYAVRCLLARTRRLASGLPTVWEAFRCGDLDSEQIRIIDRVARRVTEPATLAAIDEHAVEAAQARSPKQLQVWLLRLVMQLEPLAFQQRHRRALAERRVTVVQGADGIGYVTGEMSAADAAAIDAILAAAARNLGADDPRTDQQRRADLFTDLLGRLAFDHADTDDEDEEEDTASAESDWLEVENIDFDTGELLSTKLQRIDPQGQTIGEPVEAATHRPPGPPPKIIKRPQQQRIGIVVPLASLPADRCDLDHHEPVPKGVTSGRNLDPFCRRHHRGKTFAWHAAHRDLDGVDWTMPDAEHYRCIDEPLPTGRASVVRP
jgi:hypothetical protein